MNTELGYLLSISVGEIVVPSTCLAVLPSLWFQRKGVVDSCQYRHVLLAVFVDPWTGNYY